jgi:uncharacterized protein
MTLHFSRFTILLILALPSAGTSLAGDVPFLNGRVNDTAGLLSHTTVAELESLLKSHEDSTSNQVVLLTVPGLGGESVEEFSMRVVDTWKLGQRGKDNGVLLLIARDERAVRIEVGRGLEGDLPDITCGLIIRNEIVPHFRDGDYDGGVRAGILAILGAIQGSYTPQQQAGTRSTLDLLPRVFAFLVFLVVVGMFTLIGVLNTGCQSWFLYAFLTPFWAAFPPILLGTIPGIALLMLYLAGFPLAKMWLARSDRGKVLLKKWATSGRLAGLGGSGGSWSRSGRSSGGSGGFSGGGGGFSGGGASGGW